MTAVWKRCSTSVSVDVDLDLEDFDTNQLLQELINRQIINESTAAGLLSGRKAATSAEDLLIASHEIILGHKTEALIHIERALGGNFIGRLA